MYIFFIHSSIDGHRLFSHLTIVSNDAYEHRGADIFLSQCFHFSLINTQKWICQIMWQSYFFFEKKFELLYKVTVVYYTNGWFPSNHMETNFHMVAPIYIPTNSAQMFPFLCVLTLLISCQFANSYSNRCKMITHCGFDLHFLDN